MDRKKDQNLWCRPDYQIADFLKTRAFYVSVTLLAGQVGLVKVFQDYSNRISPKRIKWGGKTFPYPVFLLRRVN
ncbi:hypothetical protein X474_05285 [Dethiosulfatarculus sandiegensis]|uniref:Uncharacterized protein n=1 Tax=Dethiosulfatarculus sandiegensis TaxID=1429043 RepID=A0A0D2HY45_9BACT|nr:hypothetical protein X474_05285 [Dethiosulfatarculus sandiegensis]